MGSALSKQQEDRSVVILLDGDEASQSAAVEIALRLAKRTAVRIVASPDRKQPDQLSVEQIEELLARTF